MVLEKGVSNIKHAQIVQTKIGERAINIVTYKPLDEKDIKTIVYNIENKFGKDHIDYTINSVEEKDIIYTSRGKFNLVVSLLKNLLNRLTN